MNVLQINTLDTKGGGSLVAYNLKNELKKRGCLSWIFVCKKFSKDDDVFLISKNNFIEKLFKKITKRDLGLLLRNKINVFFPTDIDFFNNRRLFKSKQYKDSDIIHCHNLHSNFFNLKKLLKISKEKPVIWTLHDMWAVTHKCPYALDGKVKNGFYECPKYENIFPDDFWNNEKYLRNKKKGIYSKADFDIVVPSQWLKDKVENSILKNKNIHLIYNGINTNIFKPHEKNQVRRELNLPLDKKIIMFSGGYGGSENIWKGWKYTKKVIDYYKNNKNVIFISLGGKLKESEAENILFAGYIDNPNMVAKYYSASDVFLSSAIAENMPLALMESLACGTPVVGFDTGGTKEIIEHNQSGYVAKYLDAKDLITGVDKILRQAPEELLQMSQNGIAKVNKQFTLSKMADEYIKLYKNIINKHE